MKNLPESKINDENQPSCSRRVDESSDRCGGSLVRNGKTLYGKQRLLCRRCKRSKVLEPKKTGYGDRFNQQIVQLKKEGLGMRSTARVLGIAPSTVIRKILEISDGIRVPKIPNRLERIQVDELHTYVRRKDKEIYVIYSWSQELRRVLSLTVGTRSKSNLREVINPLLYAQAVSINTDRYSGYRGVVPTKLHTTFKRRNNGIERQNLNLRTHLKRLNRKTICYSKSAAVLLAVVKIYFWG